MTEDQSGAATPRAQQANIIIAWMESARRLLFMQVTISQSYIAEFRFEVGQNRRDRQTHTRTHAWTPSTRRKVCRRLHRRSQKNFDLHWKWLCGLAAATLWMDCASWGGWVEGFGLNPLTHWIRATAQEDNQNNPFKTGSAREDSFCCHFIFFQTVLHPYNIKWCTGYHVAFFIVHKRNHYMIRWTYCYCNT